MTATKAKKQTSFKAESAEGESLSASDLSSSEEPLPATASKIERRKQINRLAAQRSRKRKIETLKALHEKQQLLQEAKIELLKEKNSLLEEVTRLERMVADHDRNVCKNPHHRL